VVVSLIGARSDPQGLDRQARVLRQAGAHVFVSNAAAARFACELIGSSLAGGLAGWQPALLSGTEKEASS
jgi:FdrA protein